MGNGQRLIEQWLPLKEINVNADIEMAFRLTRMSRKLRKQFVETFQVHPTVLAVGTPQIQNLHLWLARRPCSTARAITAAAILPAECSHEDFAQIIGLDQIPQLAQQKILPILINANPNRDLLQHILQQDNKNPSDILVVDPMGGGGSIPLESLRLGFRTIAIDYNPVAYLILKAVLEYPARFGDQLYHDVRAEAIALITYAKTELSKFYTDDAKNYIIARGFECPSCTGLMPVFHRTRLRRSGPYIKITWAKRSKTFKIHITTEEVSHKRLECPYCTRPFTRKELFEQWVPKHQELLRQALKGDVEFARIQRKQLLQSNMLLVKQVRRGFASCTGEDSDQFVKAYIELARQAKNLKPYFPMARIPLENLVFAPVRHLGIEYWYELYNPRQLLVSATLAKYVSQRAEQLITEYGEYGAAIAVYLAFGLDKLLDYNNIATMWDTLMGSIGRLGDQYAGRKSIGLGLEYCELVAPLEKKSLGWVFEPHVTKPTATSGGICPVVKHLCHWLQGQADKVTVFMGDARNLSNILGNTSVDIVNVDPPYFDQHSYSDVSEFFWQNLACTLHPAIEAGHLYNQDRTRGKIECYVSDWEPSSPTVPRGGEMIVRRSKQGLPTHYDEVFTQEWWKEQMQTFYVNVRKVLRENGRLVIWFAHRNPKAWQAMLTALHASNLSISKEWNLRTEPDRFITRLSNSTAFTSTVLIARK